MEQAASDSSTDSYPPERYHGKARIWASESRRMSKENHLLVHSHNLLAVILFLIIWSVQYCVTAPHDSASSRRWRKFGLAAESEKSTIASIIICRGLECQLM